MQKINRFVFPQENCLPFKCMLVVVSGNRVSSEDTLNCRLQERVLFRVCSMEVMGTPGEHSSRSDFQFF